MGARPERGAYGNARGKPDKQRRRRIVRQNDPRYRSAMAEVRAHQEMLDELVARSEAPVGSQTGLTYTLVEQRRAMLAKIKPEVATEIKVKPTARKPTLPSIDVWGEGKDNWSLTDAAEMLAEGYTLRHTVKLTGWGAVYFVDLVDYLDDDAEAQALLCKLRVQIPNGDADGRSA